MKKLINLSWFFIFGVMIFDAWFAWNFQDTMQDWEANPIQLYILSTYGVWYCIWSRIITTILCFAVVMSAGKIVYVWGTITVLFMHLILFILLLLTLRVFYYG